MSAEPRPLPDGTLLADRFELQSVLGRGAFGIVYLANDLSRNDQAVIKELAPDGCHRTAEGHILLPKDSAHRLRQNFLNEAKLVASIRICGVLTVRTAFSENGTAYFATDYLPNAQTLERMLQEEGRLEVQEAMDILYQAMEVLEAIHDKGLLHRDLKPSNLLLNERGEATLIDFGAAREWQADSLATHTVLFTPGYAPLEQMAERARRGPATDIYSLCATFYEMATGRKPESATERATGTSLTPLRDLRPDVEATVAEAIEKGLALKLSDRPQSVEELRNLLSRESVPEGPVGLMELDAKMVRLQKFSFARRQCPACLGVLEEPRPLRKGVCPVCREGSIKARHILRGICPFCRNSPLRREHNEHPMRTCPKCSGWMAVKKKGLLSKETTATCPDCHASFGGDELTAEARVAVGRSEWLWHCQGCGAQLDEQSDGRLLAKAGAKKSNLNLLYPEEWDCVASGLEPGSGNAACLHCGADFYVEGNEATLLASDLDPFGFAKANAGRRLTFEDLRWLAVGKTSPEPGLVCEHCFAEFDREGDYLRLIRASNRRLMKHLNEPNTLGDWHRIAQDLPCIGEEEALRLDLIGQIGRAYAEGEIGFDDSNTVIWKGPAASGGASGNLLISNGEIAFGGLIRKRRWPLDALRETVWEDGTVWLTFRGDPEPIALAVEPIELTVTLKSGKYGAELTGEHLAVRLNSG